MNEKNIFQRMSEATAMIRTVAKNLSVQATKTQSYKAVSERDILDAVKPIEEKCGIYSYPVSREVIESHILESESVFEKKDEKTITTKTSFFSRIKTVYRFVNIDKPDEYIETTTFAEGIDSQDKGSGKAMTYADKYALMKAYKISTGDDPDQEAIKETHYTKKSEKTDEYYCADCGVKISPIRANGKVYTAEELSNKSLQTFGQVLCSECAKRAKWVMENESSNNEGKTSV